MKQQYAHYLKWEDYQNGMWRMDIENTELFVQKAMKLLSSPKEFYNIATETVQAWRVSALINLTDNSCNKRAWLGQASCCYKHKVPEHLTRIAWNLLSKKQQDIANDIATRVISEWERIERGEAQITLECI
jgi:hypothetical protein